MCSLKLFKEGTGMEKIIAQSSYANLCKLLKYNLVYIDENCNVFLTVKGRVAQKIGPAKYLELENIERALLKRNEARIKITYLGNIILYLAGIVFLVWLLYWKLL